MRQIEKKAGEDHWKKVYFYLSMHSAQQPRLISWNETQSWAPWQNGGNAIKTHQRMENSPGNVVVFSLHVLIIEKRELDSRVAI